MTSSSLTWVPVSRRRMLRGEDIRSGLVKAVEFTPTRFGVSTRFTGESFDWSCTVLRGTVTAGRRVVIAVGNRYDQQAATVIVTGDSCHVFIDGRTVRALTINRARSDQPLYDRPGPPDPAHLL